MVQILRNLGIANHMDLNELQSTYLLTLNFTMKNPFCMNIDNQALKYLKIPSSLSKTSKMSENILSKLRKV